MSHRIRQGFILAVRVTGFGSSVGSKGRAYENCTDSTRRLCTLFDVPGGSLSNLHYYSSQAGLCGLNELREPKDWQGLAEKTEETCRGLVDDAILSKPGADVVKKLDTISDVLCQTIDAAEFCRNVHEDESWRQAAHGACLHLGAYVHELNTHFGMYSALCKAMENKGSFQNQEHVLVGDMLKRDFERFGVHLEGKERDDMTSLVAFIQEAGHLYMKNAVDQSLLGSITLDEKNFEAEKKVFINNADNSYGLDSLFHKGTVMGRRVLQTSGDGRTCQGLLFHCDYEEIRKASFETYQTYPKENKKIAIELLQARKQVAGIMGYDSFSGYQLDGFSLGNTPFAVETFLREMNTSIQSAIAKEVDELEEFKRSLYTDNRGVLKPWDKDWAIQRTLPMDLTDRIHPLGRIFTIPGFVAGMSALLEEVMGLKLVVQDLLPGESWAAGVIKLFLCDVSTGESHGTIYLDLLNRRGKFGGAALFTLRCGRKLDDGSYQLPKVALVANVSAHDYLSFGDIETLSHEFGHALHSVLSRTDLQHLSGTRGPQDIIEVPSHVFERFASNPQALRLMARAGGNLTDYISDAVFNALKQRKQHCAAMKLEKTLEMCLMDQYMHGHKVGQEGFGSSNDISEFMNKMGSKGKIAKPFPPLRFSHIVGYAGNYYSYLYAHCIAAEVWGNAKSENENGWPSLQMMKEDMFKPGGSKPAKEYVMDILSAQTHSDEIITVKDSRGIAGSFPSFKTHLEDMNIH